MCFNFILTKNNRSLAKAKGIFSTPSSYMLLVEQSVIQIIQDLISGKKCSYMPNIYYAYIVVFIVGSHITQYLI